MTVCTHDNLAGGGLFGHVKSAVIQKWCSILVQTHEILGGGRFPYFSLHISIHMTD